MNTGWLTVDRLVKLLRRKNHGRQWDKIKHSRQIIFFPETELIVMMVASRVFYAAIGFNACIWPTTSHRDGLSAGTRNYVTDYYYGGSASDMNNNDNRTRTGYTCRKYVHQDDCIFLEWSGKSEDLSDIPLCRSIVRGM